jgi:hypothetical protein
MRVTSVPPSAAIQTVEVWGESSDDVDREGRPHPSPKRDRSKWKKLSTLTRIHAKSPRLIASALIEELIAQEGGL